VRIHGQTITDAVCGRARAVEVLVALREAHAVASGTADLLAGVVGGAVVGGATYLGLRGLGVADGFAPTEAKSSLAASMTAEATNLPESRVAGTVTGRIDESTEHGRSGPRRLGRVPALGHSALHAMELDDRAAWDTVRAVR